MNSVAQVMDELRELVRALRLSALAVERGIGISGAQLFVLQALAEEPAGSLNDLAARTSTHQSSVSVVVTRLAQRGLVDRVPGESDARRTAVHLTDAGRALLAASPRTAQERMVDALREMDGEMVDGLAAGLGELLNRADLRGAESSFFFEDHG